MQSARVWMVLMVAVVTLSGCQMGKPAAVPATFSNVSVVTAADPSAKFPSGSRYAFVKYAADSDKTGEAAMVQQRIEKAMTEELKKKGFKPGEYSDIRFFVAYTIGLQHEIDVLLGKSKEQGKEWITAVVMPRDYVTGALLVQVIDAKSMEPVWLGVFNADMQLVSVDEQAKRERVGYAVHEVLKSFPPK
jgi:hypothetical protein